MRFARQPRLDPVTAVTARPGGSRPSLPALSRLDWLLGSLLGLCLVLAQRGVLALWWTDDDLFNLRWVESQPLLGQLVDPAIWRQLPFRMITPALFASLEADLALFGPLPWAWHLHQLAALGLAATLFFLVLRLWTGRVPALVATLAGFCSPPVIGLASAIPVRHYVEGASLALLAVLGWTLALRATRRGVARAWSFAAGLFYLAAALAKEVFVPLPFLLAVLPVAPRAVRLRALTPQAGALAIYAVYRRAMLGTWGGGYGWAVSLEDYPRLLSALPGKLGEAALTPIPWLAGALFAVELLAVFAVFGRRRDELVALAVAGMALVGPLLPVSTEVPARYAAIPALALAAATAAALERLTLRHFGLAASLAGALAAIALAARLAAWPPILARAERQSLENQAFLALGAQDALRAPSAPPGAMGELVRWVAGSDRGGRVPAAWFYDDVFLCRVPGDWRVWEFDAAAGAVVRLSPQRLADLRRDCAPLGPTPPLAAHFSWRSGILRWRLGPEGEGRFQLVVESGRAVIETPADGAFGVSGRERVRVAVRRTMADGRTVVSPDFDLAPESEMDYSVGETGGRPGS